jgi:hypothetical protein
MKFYSISFLFFLSCNTNGSDKTLVITDTSNVEVVTSNNNNPKAVCIVYPNDTTIITLKCVDINLLDIRIYNTDRRELSIQQGKLITEKIEIPTQQTIQGFAVNWIKATEKGFEVSVEYGGSSRYYNKDFRFYYEDGGFVLRDILIDTFDKQNPEDEKSYTKKTDTLRVPVKFKDFKFEDYL